MRIDRSKTALSWLCYSLLCLMGSFSPAADKTSAGSEDPNEPLIQMIVDLLSDSDRDMQALGLQQVREEMPGEAATKRFADLLPKLPPEGQAALLGALADRNDATALPAVMELLTSAEETVRAAALRALGSLGTAAEVPLLAEKAATGSDRERDAAKQSLIRLRGEGAGAAMVAALDAATPGVQAELLAALAARGAKEALPSVLASARAEESEVRLAALNALRFLAGKDRTAELVEIVKAADEEQVRRKAELALLAVCSRGREKCGDALVAGLEGADAPSKVVLLSALARAGGPTALEAVVRCLNDNDETVHDEAVRTLSIWQDPSAAPHLLEIAQTSDDLRHQVLAIRGLVRLAAPHEEKPADVPMLTTAMKLAKRPQEKRLVLGAAGGAAKPEALTLTTAALDDPALAEEAALATVMIAEKLPDGDSSAVGSAMQEVQQVAKDPQIRKRAQALVQSRSKQ